MDDKNIYHEWKSKVNNTLIFREAWELYINMETSTESF